MTAPSSTGQNNDEENVINNNNKNKPPAALLPSTFSLSLSKVKTTKRKKNKKAYASSSRNPTVKSAGGSSSRNKKNNKITDDDDEDILTISSSSSSSSEKEAEKIYIDNPKNNTTTKTPRNISKKRPRHQEGSNKKRDLPIPSFNVPPPLQKQPTVKLEKLSQLERKFFGEDDDYDDNEEEEDGKIAKEKKCKVKKQKKKTTSSQAVSTSKHSKSKDDVVNLMEIDDDDDDDDEELFHSTSTSLTPSQLTTNNCKNKGDNNDARVNTGNDDIDSNTSNNNVIIKRKTMPSIQGTATEEQRQSTKESNAMSDTLDVSINNYDDNANEELEENDAPFMDFHEEENVAEEKTIIDNSSDMQATEIKTPPQVQATTSTKESTREKKSSNLEYEIDRLYEKCDKSKVTRKWFCARLSERGIVLDKRSRVIVQERLFALINNQIVPFSTNHHDDTMKQDQMKHPQENHSDNQNPRDTRDITLEHQTKQNIDPNILEPNQEGHNVTENVRHSKIPSREVSTNRKRSDNQDINVGKQKISSKSVYEQKVNVEQIFSESTATTKGRHGRNKKASATLSTSENPTDAEEIGQHESETGPAASKPRKRTRKVSCALCKTCPCQKVQARDNVTTLDMNTFSRSAAAMEKALIRRIQKLEKSAESLEEQTEMVRRKLKAHRRVIWKQKERETNNKSVQRLPKITEDSWFLPDAEVLEQQRADSVSMGLFAVHEAQLRLFERKPSKFITYQLVILLMPHLLM
jgi:hypothetical protein